MGANVEGIPVDGDSPLGQDMTALTGHDVIALADLFATLQAEASGCDPQDVLDEMGRKASEFMGTAIQVAFDGEAPTNGRMTVFLCYLCLHAMASVYAQASSFELYLNVNDRSCDHLSEILASRATPPRDGNGDLEQNR